MANDIRVHGMTVTPIGAEERPGRAAAAAYLVTKRVFDVVVSLVAIVVLSPVFLAIALVITVESPGPVFFGQTRVGLGYRRIRIWKFRKMRDDLPAQGSMLTLRRDPRMTRVGGFLERTKLDELPQFYNVLLGDMSIVGPRPEVPEFVDHYPAMRRAVLSVRPGLFGPSQNHFRDESRLYPVGEDVEAFYVRSILPLMLELDAEYVRRRSTLVDLGLLIRGIARVLFH